MNNRRKFLKQLSTSALAMAAAPASTLALKEYAEKTTLLSEARVTANDKIRIGCIGMGIMGFENVRTSLKVPGVELAAVCDLYKGRLERAKEVFGNQIFVTQDYKELLAKKDIDAVIIATSDHWHDIISMDAMKAGKDVYCEKPIVQKLGQGWPVINTQKQTGRVFQVGSQRTSSVALIKARDLYREGKIGKINCIEASFERQSALGAWEYTMPTDANPSTVAWDKYLRENKNRAFDKKKFFWWRNYQEFGTGVAGDLFVHLLTGIHFITGSHGPNTIFSTGALTHWKDGRDVPDVMTGVLEYKATKEHPAFQVLLKVNLISGIANQNGGKTLFVGDEGAIDFGWNNFTIYRNKMPVAPGYGGWDTFDTYTKDQQKKILEEYNKKYSEADKNSEQFPKEDFSAPDGYDERLDHHINFYESIRNRKPVEQDATFGYRAAAPCLACNQSYASGKVVKWDGTKMQVVNN